MPRSAPHLLRPAFAGLSMAIAILGILGSSFAVSLVSPDKASAQDRDFAVRIEAEGLDQLEPVLQPLLPESFTVPAFEQNLYDCPGSDIVAEVPDFDVLFPNWHEVDLAIQDDVIVVEAEIDIEVGTMVRIDQVYACFGEANCDVHARADHVRIRLELAAGTGSEGGIELHGLEAEIDLAPEDFDLTSEGCFAGDALEWLVRTFEGTVLDKVLPLGEEALSTKVAPLLAGVLASTVNMSIEVGSFGLAGGIRQFDIASTGITLSGDVEVDWLGELEYTAPRPPLSAAEGAALPAGFGPGAFQIAVTDELVTRALYQAWRGGMIHGLASGFAPTIELGGEGIAQQLGLPEGTRIVTGMNMTRPLHAHFGRDDGQEARIDLRGMEVALTIETPGAPSSNVMVAFDGTMAAELVVDQELGALVLDVTDMDVTQLSIESAGGLLSADPARMRRFVSTTVMGMIGERLSRIPVAPALHAVAGNFIHLRSLESQTGWERLSADIVSPDPEDFTAPETFYDERTDLFPAGTVSIHVSGEDDTTPSALLRYRAWLDGQLLTEEPTGLRAIRMDVADGEHRLEVAAVDLNGNEDREPAVHDFVADGVPPELTIGERPLDIVYEGPARVTWTATDDGPGAVESRWILRIIGDDGTTSVVEEFGFATGVTEMAVGNLLSDRLYEIEIIVRDEAGNVTSEAIGFVMDPGGSGCSATDAQDTPLWLLGALLMLMMVRRRRGSVFF